MHQVASRVVRLFDRYMPEPFAFGIVMTLVAMLVAYATTPSSAEQVIVAWGNGLSSLLAFITQVSLTILFAFSLAHLGPVPNMLAKLSGLPRTARQAYAFCAVFTSAVSLLAWPLGTIAGGLMAREVALRFRERGDKVHYPLLGGAAFSGYVVWHMGYSASAPLLVATPGNPMEPMLGGVLPVTATLLAPFNLATLLVTVLMVAFVASRLGPADEDMEIIDPARITPFESDDGAGTPRGGFAGWVENARWPTTTLGLLLVGYLAIWFYEQGPQLELNVVNWSFFALCLLLSKSPINLVTVMMNAGRAVIPALLQYPLYAGIMGLMLGTGVVANMAGYFAETATATTLPFIAFLSGGLINMFIPSGGAQWAVQGPAFLEAAELLGTDPALVVMGVAYGDQWTNIIHPFVAIPILIMTRLPASKVLSYAFLIFPAAGITLGGGILIASALS